MTWNNRRGNISRGLEVVSRVDDVEFILTHGTEALGLPSGGSKFMDLEGLRQNLELCAKRTKPIPMVVANPDYVPVEARNMHMMPGHWTRITDTNAAYVGCAFNDSLFLGLIHETFTCKLEKCNIHVNLYMILLIFPI